MERVVVLESNLQELIQGNGNVWLAIGTSLTEDKLDHIEPGPSASPTSFVESSHS